MMPNNVHQTHQMRNKNLKNLNDYLSTLTMTTTETVF